MCQQPAKQISLHPANTGILSTNSQELPLNAVSEMTKPSS